MKKQSTNNKNVIKTIKILTIVLLIILISMIGFFGIYKQNKNQMSNTIKDYSYSMNLKGARTIKLTIKDDTSDEEKTEDNFNKSKKVLEGRLKELGVEEYNISLNTKTGEMIIEIPENTKTDTVVSNLSTVGKFEIIDNETEEVLLNNSNLKSANVLYNTTTSGTSVYLEIAFNKDGKSKLEDISKTYATSEESNTTSSDENNTESDENTTENTETEDSTNKSTQKQIKMKIDDDEIMTTSFDEPITTGKIQLSVGSATTDTDTLQNYISQAQNIATVLNNGNLPVEYDIEKNQYILSDISKQDLGLIVIAVSIVVVIGLIALIIKYKTKGLLAGISYVGLAALYLLLIRYANVVISIESIFGILTILILNYIFTVMILNNIEKNNNIVNKATLETYKKFFGRIIPICLIAIVFCFIKWIPISSFGMITFWGLIMIATYNAVITRSLLKIDIEEK